MDFRFDIIYEYREMFFYGALTTLGLTVVATLGGTILGLFGALARIIRFEKGNRFTRALRKSQNAVPHGRPLERFRRPAKVS